MPKRSSNKHLPWLNELCAKKECNCNKAPLERTLRAHAYNIAWLAERIDGFDVEKLTVPKPETIMSYLDDSNVSNGRKSSSYSAMKVWHRCHNDQIYQNQYNPHLLECHRCLNNDAAKQLRNKKEQKNWVDYKDFTKMRKILCSRVCACAKEKKRLWSKQEFTDANMAFILEYHSKYPLRNELHSVKYSKNKSNDWSPFENYLDQDTQEIVWRNFKTKNSLGEQRHKLTRKMWRLWRYILKQHTELGINDDHIILGRQWRGLSSSGFASYFDRELKEFDCCKDKRVTPMVFRKSHITHKLRRQIPIHDHEKYAKKCLHSSEQNHKYRKRDL